ncbi:hypothetical protein [Saccharothrix algeriensis]|uniref:Uncharacterized protein n=1 Tax=Saccharothrix algeriensis TaxID=173560 RepID=A0ABS2S312_9PSEU|nr:hypothetical protein [Saccharothrix algeriensis]MBM7810330.1 hypothetical protein [Saccharothrix algeriensis]
MAATAAAMVLGQVGQAAAVTAEQDHAEAVRTTAEAAGALIERVSPAAAQAADLEPGVRADSARGPVGVTLPKAGADALLLEAGGVSVGLGLPEQARGRDARTLADGKVVLTDPASPVQVVTERVDDLSARTLVVLNDASAPAEYRFDLRAPQGSTLAAQADGGVHVLDAKGEVLAQVAAPWAKDAAGKDVATSYRIDGDALVQSVRTNSTTQFPVVADPKLTYGFGVYLNLWGFEARAYGAAIALVVAGGAIAVCTSANIPAAIAYLVKLVCSAGIGTAAWDLLKNMDSWIKSGGINNNTCYQKKIIPNTGGWVGVDGSNCQ